MLKLCRGCNRKLPFSSFTKHEHGLHGLRPRCRACIAAVAKVYRRKNRAKIRKRERAYEKRNKEQIRIRKACNKYGLTVAEYHALFARQRGRCAICGQRKELVIDHDHRTNKVRGLLCRLHNAALGHLGDTLSAIEKTRRYLLGDF